MAGPPSAARSATTLAGSDGPVRERAAQLADAEERARRGHDPAAVQRAEVVGGGGGRRRQQVPQIVVLVHPGILLPRRRSAEGVGQVDGGGLVEPTLEPDRRAAPADHQRVGGQA